ncbi:MAG: hypothetical protein IPL19_07740 [Sandaracinaceae bacterium]|nr:hypothetical protein [Sandaracinaceae bacterium]MBK8407865.1 hypothetical protein [Sandaracinaceae bacterium]
MRAGRVLVVGGTGYYGQKVMDALGRAGFDVTSAARSGADVRVDLRDASTFAAFRDYAAIVNASDSVRARPDDALRFALAEGLLWVEMGADPALTERALSLSVAPARGTVVLGAGIFPGLSTALAVGLAGADAESVELGIRLSPLSGAGRGNCALMTHTLALPSVRYDAGERVTGRTVGPRAVMPFYGDEPQTAAEMALPDADLIARATKAPTVRARFALQPGFLLHNFRALAWLADRLGTLRGGLLAVSYVMLWALRSVLLRRVSSPVDLSVVVQSPSGTRRRLVRVPDGTAGTALALAAFVRELLPRRLPTGVVVAGQLVSADALIGAMRAIHGSDACVLSDPA